MGEKGNACRGLAEKLEGRRPLGTPRPRKEDIKIYLKRNKQRGVNWIHLAQVWIKGRDL